MGIGTFARGTGSLGAIGRGKSSRERERHRPALCMRGCRLGALACLALTLFAGAFIPDDAAYADEGAGQLSVGAAIFYAGYSTNWMSVDGNAAYCATPTLATPRSGPYAKEPLRAPSGRSAETAADLWFGFASPGFEPGLWPSTWYDGTPMTDARYAVAAHILLSDTFSSSGESALHGCSSAFREWARREVLGFDAHGAIINENATGRRIAARIGEVPATFTAFQLTTGTSTQSVVSFTYTPLGAIELEKAASQPDIARDNPLYSIEGAVFGVFRDEACTDKALEMTTDAKGMALADDVPAGTYWVKELVAPTHMTVNETAYRVEVRDRQRTRVNGGAIEDRLQAAKVDVLVRKTDSDACEGAPQGDATLGGALFSVAYYPQLSGPVEGNPLLSWTFRTDDAGEIHLSDAASIDRYLVAGDPLCRDSMGQPALALGTYVVREIAAPSGYLPDEQEHTIVVSPAGEGEHDCLVTFDADAGDAIAVEESVVRGGIEVAKVDAELRLPEAVSGAGSAAGAAPILEGVGFEISNGSANRVLVGDAWFEPGQVIGTIFTERDEQTGTCRARTGADALPFGTYIVQETQASTGYLLSDGEPRRVEVRQAGTFADAASDGTALVFANQVVRNDLELRKIRESDGQALQVAFLLTNLATGEAHVLACDGDGTASTAADRALRSSSCNGNDGLLGQERIRAQDMDPSAGIWFGVSEGGTVAAPNDDLAALPFGEYELQELPCDANEGFELVSKRFSITSDSSLAGPVEATVTNREIEIEQGEERETGEESEAAGSTLAKTGDSAAKALATAAAVAAIALGAALGALARKRSRARRRRYRYGCRR